MIFLEDSPESNPLNILSFVLVIVAFIAVIVILNFVISPLVQGRMFVKEMFKKGDVEGAYKDAPRESPWFQHIQEMRKAEKANEKIGYTEVSITSFDKLKLVGYLMSKPKQAKGTIILVHGCRSHSLREWACMANHYYMEGYNVLIIDQRAHNKSQGQFMTFGVYEHKDLLDWIKFIDEYYNGKYDIYLHGMSLGAGVVNMVSNKVDPSKVKGIISESGYYDGVSLVKAGLPEPKSQKAYEKTMKSISKRTKRYYGFTIDEINPNVCVRDAKVPMLFIIGSADDSGTHQTDMLYRECNAPYKDMLIVNGATHGECQYRGGKEYLARIHEILKGNKNNGTTIK